MPWTIPQPTDIASGAAAAFEAQLAAVYALLNPTAPPATPDARSPTSIQAIFTRVLAMAVFDLYIYQSRLAQELMPDTAVDWLSRHGSIWGVPQDQAVAAQGNLVLVGAPTSVVAQGAQFTVPSGAIYDTVNSGTIGSTGTISMAVSAAVPGMAGDLAAGVTLTAVTPVGGLITQAGTIDVNGVTGGANLESTDSWRQRILERIRARGTGGDVNDFVQWTQEVLPGALVLPMSPGAGFITVVIAMPTGTTYRVPTSTELSEATAWLNDATNRKPLGAPVVNVIAATLQPVNFTLHLNPDTPATQAGALSALQEYFVVGDINIGGTLDISRSDAALSSGSGAYNFDRTAPTGDVASASYASMLTLGSVSFV